MGLFSNKKQIKEEIPKLPELPELEGPALLPKSEIPDVPSGLPEIETSPLPSLPDSNSDKKFNQEAIKQEISKPKGMQKSRFAPPQIISTEKRTLELPTPALKSSRLTKKAEPIFVRLDKFQITVETFEEIKTKIQEIGELLQRTKEVKQKEEQELIEWEREIQTIKSRIDLIDKNIFNKLD